MEYRFLWFVSTCNNGFEANSTSLMSLWANIKFFPEPTGELYGWLLATLVAYIAHGKFMKASFNSNRDIRRAKNVKKAILNQQVWSYKKNYNQFGNIVFCIYTALTFNQPDLQQVEHIYYWNLMKTVDSILSAV